MNDLNIKLRSLAVFRALLDDGVITALLSYLDDPSVDGYSAFVAALYATEKRTLAGHIQSIVNSDENPYIRMIGKGITPWPEMEENVWQELEFLQETADLTPEKLAKCLDWGGYLPNFGVKKVDLAASYRERCQNIGRYGYGIYAKFHAFYLRDGKITPVLHPDATRLSHLVGYQREKKILLDNTHALLQGRPAANVLLSGDAGTGKSSTVKAVANELHGEGLRILEVRKEQLHQIPEILDHLSSNPLKFILFIDDLSFQRDDDNFSALKAILEGSVSAKAKNTVIYATSNRRHLVKESFSDREGDDIHRNDTMQEIISLSERFGIQVTFQKPSKAAYLDIVHALAAANGLEIPKEELDARAEQFALTRGGRSPRAAKQFVDSLL